ncbi:MAG TPA: hypothetical protein VJR50_21495, partial [Mycobacterium sp.]|nr:hypothetical protein [Mycobacterium sp.]
PPVPLVAVAVAPGPIARANDPGVEVHPDPIDTPPTDAHVAFPIAGETSDPAASAAAASPPTTTPPASRRRSGEAARPCPRQ